MSEARWPLSPRAARVFYGVADAWLPSGPDVDVVAALAPQLGSAGQRRRMEVTLWLLEWSPRLLLRSLRGLCWMEQSARAAWLERLERGRVRSVGRSLASLRSCVLAAHAAAVSGSGAPQSFPGA